MRKVLISGLAAASLSAACTTTNIQQTTNTFEAPQSASTTMLVTPDVQVNAILATGLQEPRADWSENAKKNLQNALKVKLQERSSDVVFMNPNQNLSAQQVQLLKLSNVVIKAGQYQSQLKNKEDTFDLTIGPTASLLAGSSGADFALATTAQAAFQTAAARAVTAASIILGAGVVHSGVQQANLSLIDLDSGDIVWSNTVNLGPGYDIRSESGALRVADTLLKDFPLE